MAAELQTVSAVFDLLKLAYEVGKFLKQVKDADKVADALSEKIQKLTNVLHAVQVLLDQRVNNKLPSGSNAQLGVEVVGTIEASILGCTHTLTKLQKRLGNGDIHSKRSLLEKTKIALRQPSIGRMSDEVEARVHILSTELAVLQLFDQSSSGVTARINHDEIVQAIERLGCEVIEGNRIQKEIICRQHQQALRKSQTCKPEAEADLLADGALNSLSICLQRAENIHEHYTSEYLPDDRSIRLKRVTVEQDMTPSAGSRSPASVGTPSEQFVDERATIATPSLDDDNYENEAVWPLEMLNMHIASFTEQAAEKREAGHYQQAESYFHQALCSSEIRESRYGVPFLERVHLQEEIAEMYRKQKKWGEAISSVHQLLRSRAGSIDSTASEASAADQTSSAEARQRYLLAGIYYDRYISNAGTISTQTDDIESAERQAMIAFNITWRIPDASGRSPKDAEQHRERIELFARILDARDKTVESSNLRRLLSGQPVASDGSSSMHRSSINTNPCIENDFVEDKHEILAHAIRSGATEQIHTLLLVDVDVDKLCKTGMTLLMEAVKQCDESTVHKLLGPDHNADVNRANRRKLTALHVAAASGLIDMARCIMSHDGNVEAMDAKGETPVVKAVVAGHTEMVEFFFQQHEEEFLQCRGRDEWSLLHFAVHGSGKEMIDLLLDLAPDLINALDRAGKTALHHCAEYELLEGLTALLENEQTADVNATDSVGRNALYFAASRPPTIGRENIVNMLLSSGASVDESKKPPRMRDYAWFRNGARRDSTLSDISVKSTAGLSAVTSSSSTSRLSRVLGRLVSRH